MSTSKQSAPEFHAPDRVPGFFTTIMGIELQRESIERWKPKLSPRMLRALQSKAESENLKLTDKSTGYDVWRGQDLCDFIQNWTIDPNEVTFSPVQIEILLSIFGDVTGTHNNRAVFDSKALAANLDISVAQLKGSIGSLTSKKAITVDQTAKLATLTDAGRDALVANDRYITRLRDFS